VPSWPSSSAFAGDAVAVAVKLGTVVGVALGDVVAAVRVGLLAIRVWSAGVGGGRGDRSPGDACCRDGGDERCPNHGIAPWSNFIGALNIAPAAARGGLFAKSGPRVSRKSAGAVSSLERVQFPDDDTVLEHGFRFRPTWWAPRVPNGWGSYLDELPPLERGYHRINRHDLLTIDGLPQTLLAGYVWGTGTSAFLVGRRARVFRDNDATRITDCLQAVADELSRGNIVDAYYSMLRGQPKNLKHLGPSFFTKFLYAADADGNQPGRALILDQFVAVALKDIDGWDISRTGPWDSSTYGRWLEHAHRLAAAEGVRPDAVEMAYFNHGRGIG
jgi:hypothetical protein